NLGDETTPEHVERGRAFAREVAKLCDLPLVATIVPECAACPGTHVGEPCVEMPRYVKRPWE
ncbi:MAG: hypothetical protein U0J70_03690, partial [Atopobiaceae bacterium]|nr:hypothetical protein [Atopobiaceae bacterium]